MEEEGVPNYPMGSNLDEWRLDVRYKWLKTKLFRGQLPHVPTAGRPQATCDYEVPGGSWEVRKSFGSLASSPAKELVAQRVFPVPASLVSSSICPFLKDAQLPQWEST